MAEMDNKELARSCFEKGCIQRDLEGASELIKQATKTKKKRPGPKPELISLHPFTFDEVLDAALTSKSKKERKKKEFKRGQTGLIVSDRHVYAIEQSLSWASEV